MISQSITNNLGFEEFMNFLARGSARFALAAAVVAVPCLAQELAGEHNIATPGLLNPGSLSLGCDGQSQNAPGAAPTQTASSESSASSAPATAAGKQQEEPPGGKRVFGVLPNYRTASSCDEGVPLSDKRKLHIAVKDSFDYPLVALAAAYAGFNQLTNDDPSFGQGIKGYAHRLATNYADQAIGNMMTEGFLPVLFHQDPRYFRRGPAYSPWKRTWYAMTRVIVTDSDSGHKQFNYSEWIGNATAAGVSNIWEPDDRTFKANTGKLFEYIGTDALSQVLKEFWPDIKHRLFHKGDPSETCSR